jgi:hypothetical protein
LQSKQKAIAAIKAQQYPEAVHILEEGEQLQVSRIVIKTVNTLILDSPRG